VAAGTVVATRDGRPDQPPPENPTPPSASELPGNRVILRVRPGVFITYAYKLDGNTLTLTQQRNQNGAFPNPFTLKLVRVE